MAYKPTTTTITHVVMDVSHWVNLFYVAALKPIIPLMHRAAHGVLSSSIGGLSVCCGNQAFNPTTSFCCLNSNGINTILPLGGKCCCNQITTTKTIKNYCGNQVYDPSVYTCCLGMLVKGPYQGCCATQAYNPLLFSCCHSELKYLSRC